MSQLQYRNENQISYFNFLFPISIYQKNEWHFRVLFGRRIRLPKVSFRVFDELQNEIQKIIIRFRFYLNMKNDVQIIDSYLRV